MSLYGCFHESHAPSVFDESEHVYRLCSFERRRGEARELTQELTPEGNDTDLLEHWQLIGFAKLERGNRRARKIERIRVYVHHDFDGVGIQVIVSLRNAMDQIYAPDGSICQ